MDWINILSIILTMFFGVLSFVFYRKGIKKKKLLIIAKSTLLISQNLSNYSGLKISYNNEEIQSLSSTTIIIKNTGNDIIESSDITPIVPINILTSDRFLLIDSDKYHVSTSNDKTNPTIEEKDNSNLVVHFDFIKPKDTISITLLHNGDISVSGDLKDGDIDMIIDDIKSYNDQKDKTTNETDAHSSNIMMSMVITFNLTMLSALMSFFILNNGILHIDNNSMLLILMVILIDIITILISLLFKSKK